MGNFRVRQRPLLVMTLLATPTSPPQRPVSRCFFGSPTPFIKDIVLLADKEESSLSPSLEKGTLLNPGLPYVTTAYDENRRR